MKTATRVASGLAGLILFTCPTDGCGALFFDDYSTDTQSHYVQYWANGTFTHNTNAGTLDYSRTGADGFATTAYLVKTNVYSLAGNDSFIVEGSITYDVGSGAQAGLVFGTASGSGGFVVSRREASDDWRVGTLQDNLNDWQNLTAVGSFDGAGTYFISVLFARAGDDVTLDISIAGPSTTQTLANHVFEGSADYGGDQVGWWVRNNSTTPAQSFNYLSVVPEPGTVVLLTFAGAALLACRRHRRRNTCRIP